MSTPPQRLVKTTIKDDGSTLGGGFAYGTVSIPAHNFFKLSSGMMVVPWGFESPHTVSQKHPSHFIPYLSHLTPY